MFPSLGAMNLDLFLVEFCLICYRSASSFYINHDSETWSHRYSSILQLIVAFSLGNFSKDIQRGSPVNNLDTDLAGSTLLKSHYQILDSLLWSQDQPHFSLGCISSCLAVWSWYWLQIDRWVCHSFHWSSGNRHHHRCPHPGHRRQSGTPFGSASLCHKCWSSCPYYHSFGATGCCSRLPHSFYRPVSQRKDVWSILSY